MLSELREVKLRVEDGGNWVSVLKVEGSSSYLFIPFPSIGALTDRHVGHVDVTSQLTGGRIRE